MKHLPIVLTAVAILPLSLLLSGCEILPAQSSEDLTKAKQELESTKKALASDIASLNAFTSELDAVAGLSNARAIKVAVEDVRSQGKHWHTTFHKGLPDSLVGLAVEPLKPAGLKLHQEASKPKIIVP